jgi:hypothetical protein
MRACVSVLAQQANEPGKSIATPPIRRAESRRGRRKAVKKARWVRPWRLESAALALRDGGVDYRRWAKIVIRWGWL